MFIAALVTTAPNRRQSSIHHPVSGQTGVSIQWNTTQQQKGIELWIYTTTCTDRRNMVLSQSGETQEYMLCDPVYLKFWNRQAVYYRKQISGRLGRGLGGLAREFFEAGRNVLNLDCGIIACCIYLSNSLNCEFKMSLFSVIIPHLIF